MTNSPYELIQSDDKLLFEFESIGEKRITKLIEYTALRDYPHIYNLGFGDKQPDGSIDDKVITDNGDMEKVFATVISSMKEFFRSRPDKVIFFAGSSSSRQRLYRGILSKFLEEIVKDYKVFGLAGDTPVPFEPGKSYDGYYIKLK